MADGAAPSDPPDFDFYTPAASYEARMTNDRLALENPALRRNLELTRRDLEASRQVVQRLQSEASERRVALEKARLAEGDLKWLVNRLASSPAGWILRRWSGWRTMEERWRTRELSTAQEAERSSSIETTGASEIGVSPRGRSRRLLDPSGRTDSR